MKCKYCDGVIAEGDRFCPHCGVACRELKAAVTVAPPPAPRVRKKKQRPPRFKVNPRSALRGIKFMKWHKFTVNFLLFVQTALLIAGGTAYLLGYAHSSGAELIYKYYPSMYTLDLAAAGLSYLLAIFALIVRFRLAHLRKNSRGLLHLFCVSAILFPVGYQVAGYFLCNATLISLGYIVHVAIYFILVLVNIISYSRKKRRSLFVN